MEARVSNRLRQLLAERQWSQRDLADLTGLSYDAIRRAARPGSNPSLEVAFVICKVLEMEIEDLFWLEGVASRKPARSRNMGGGARRRQQRNG